MVAFHQHNPRGFPLYQGVEDLFQSGGATAVAAASETGGCGGSTAAHHPQALLYNLAVVKEKVQQVHSLVNLVVAQSAPDSIQHESLSMVASGARSLIQDLIVAASSMMYTFQQIAAATDTVPSTAKNEDDVLVFPHMKSGGGFTASGLHADAHEAFDAVLHDDALYSYGGGEGGDRAVTPQPPSAAAGTAADCEIIEIDAADLLAKYTHYCQVCGKGFKRDANLRMHMRAHGDEYKSNAALANPAKGGASLGQEAAAAGEAAGRKYSCPQDGCRWNKKHAKFQPLKSMICVKNHYKRSHCPKMYVCNRCNCKQFAVLSDLRTHEKHCGDLKWLCSCGTTFSRKDKLMGHLALFVGHNPVVNSFTK